MIITVGGDAASGKSTLAKSLASKLGYKHISAGSIMRELAKEKGVDLIEFSKYAEGKPEIDEEIDRRQKELAVGDCVVDGRLSAHFIEADFKIWLTAPNEVRAERIRCRDKFSGLEDAVKHIRDREDSERKRYKTFYDINHPEYGIYDLVLNTEKYGIQETLDLVYKAVELLK